MTEKITLELTKEEFYALDRNIMMVEETESILEKIKEGYKKLEALKSPVEEAYKDWWGEYPGDENWTSDATRWQGFQAGYNAAYEEKVAQEQEEEPQELKTLYQMLNDEEFRDDVCYVVKEWMSQYTHNEMCGEYASGYEDCMLVLEEHLK